MSVIHKPEEIEKTISKISTYIVGEHLKGKIPLFVIGSGISTDLEPPEHLKGKVEKMSVPKMFEMLEKLQSLYNEMEKNGIGAKYAWNHIDSIKNRDMMLEGPWMTKYNDKYYLQYATFSDSYVDGVWV